MITIEPYTDNKIEEWNRFVENSKNGIFMFNRNFMEYHRDRFKDFSMMFYDDEDLVAIMPASIHDNEVRSHGGLTYGGFITNEKMKQHKILDCFNLLIQYMQEKKITRLLYKSIPHIYHKQPSEEDLYALYKINAKLFKIEPSTTLLLKHPYKMPKGRKAQISRAKREGVVIEQSNDFESFINLENSVLSEHHNTKAVHSAKELELLHSRFEEEIQLWVAKYNGEIIAGTLLFIYPNVVHTQYMAANVKAREIGGLDLLIKTVMDIYSQSHTYFDFGISTEDNGKYLNEGLISQKEGFGGRTICYQTWEILL